MKTYFWCRVCKCSFLARMFTNPFQWLSKKRRCPHCKGTNTYEADH
jgi:hypothetical protein